MIRTLIAANAKLGVLPNLFAMLTHAPTAPKVRLAGKRRSANGCNSTQGAFHVSRKRSAIRRR